MATFDSNDFINQLNKQLEKVTLNPVQSQNIGTIYQLGDGVATLAGLTNVMYGEIIEFDNGIKGLVLNLLADSVAAIILGDYTQLKPGAVARATGQIFEVQVGDAMIGRVVNPTSEPIDGKGSIKTTASYPVEKIAPGIITRQQVNVPLLTGIKAVDSLTPIGRGQRQLIIGDRGTGKSSIAITTILNQKDQNVICIYVPIGQKKSFIAQTIEVFARNNALDYTIVVAATASDPVTYQYLAPYAGTAIAEYFMDQGKDVLIVYDDLSKHAWAYREISLLLKRPAGREAYPGDVFYLHSRLLERSCRLSQEHGGGSITSLPIIETQAGDIAAYIPTNVISITDGQIYLEPSLFNSGQRPAINSGQSVSRVGSNAQTKSMKQVAGTMKLELAQYRELQAFSQFASELDEQTKARLDKGARITQILKQNWDKPYPIADQVVVIWAVNNGYLANVSVENVPEWESKYLDYLHIKAADLLEEITVSREKLNENQIKKLKSLIEKFNATTAENLMKV